MFEIDNYYVMNFSVSTDKQLVVSSTKQPIPHVECTLQQHTCGNCKCVP
jgi:hypothetical protein